MGRDYKHAGGRKRRGQADEAPPWQWFGSGLAVGLAVALAVFTYDRRPGGIADPAEAPPRPVAAADTSTDAAKDSAESAKDDEGFRFYDLLPKFEFVLPEIEEPIQGGSTREPAAPPEPGAYVLQAGSFRNAADAERMKATLALQGHTSRIERVSISSGERAEEWHRVRMGPYDDPAKIDAIRRQLRGANIEVLLVRVGD